MSAEAPTPLEFTNKNEPARTREVKTFVGDDIVLLTPVNRHFKLRPGEYKEFVTPLPQDYFYRYQRELYPHFYAQFSTRSVLQQAGLSVHHMHQHSEANVTTLTIRNSNPNTTLSFPMRLPLGRFFIRGSVIAYDELERLIPMLFSNREVPEGVSITDNGIALSLPITRFARVTRPVVDLLVLDSIRRNNRTTLDEYLGFKWETDFEAELGEIVIGETPKILLPSDVNGEISIGSDDMGNMGHAQSPFVDPAFGVATNGVALRTEVWHTRDSATPVSRVEIQFFHI